MRRIGTIWLLAWLASCAQDGVPRDGDPTEPAPDLLQSACALADGCLGIEQSESECATTLRRDADRAAAAGCGAEHDALLRCASNQTCDTLWLSCDDALESVNACLASQDTACRRCAVAYTDATVEYGDLCGASYNLYFGGHCRPRTSCDAFDELTSCADAKCFYECSLGQGMGTDAACHDCVTTRCTTYHASCESN